MPRRLNRIVQSARDVILLIVGFVITATLYGKWVDEPAVLVVIGLMSVIEAMTVANLVFTVLKVRRTGFYYGNAIFQLLVGLLMLGLVQLLGIILVSFNVVVLATLGEKKSPAERALQIPLSRAYRAVDGTGVLVILASMLLPWISVSDNSISLISIYSSLITHGGLPSVSISPIATTFALLGLFLTPAILAMGIVALIWRRFAIICGTLAVLVGSGFLGTLGLTSPGPYVLVIGGALLLVAFFGARRFSSSH